MDPAAGTDVYPTRQKLETYSFNEDTNLDSLAYILSYDEGAEIIENDDSLYNQVLHVKEAQVRLSNPFTAVNLQNGAGFTFWLRVPEGQADTKMLSLPDGTSLLPAAGIPGMEDGYVRFVGVQIKTTGFVIYIDGEAVTSTSDADNESLIASLNEAQNVIVGNGSGEFFIDDITFVRNQMTAKDVERPTIKKGAVKLPDPVYLLDFNSGLGDAEIVGDGSLRSDDATGFGKVFQNVPGAKSTNYLRLPSHILSHSAESQEMTIGFWVNAVNAGPLNDYTYSPLFAAYANAPAGDNGMPMFVLQSRGPVQVNCNGWSDFTGTNHVDGKVNIYHQNAWEAGDGAYNFVNNWFDDGQWHYYTISMKATQVTVYLDGEVKNQWEFDPAIDGQNVTGLFSNGNELTYPCLGGNQAWNWGDPDAGFAFDDFVVYDKALSADQVEQIIINKTSSGSGIVLPEPVFFNSFDNTSGLTIVGGGSFETDPDSHFGKIFQNVTGGMRQNYLLLPEDALSHSAETQQMSIGVWVNSAKAGASGDYMWAPLFMAYGAAPVNGENTWPMFACQYRGVLQVNNNGWTDYTDVQHVNGANVLYHDATDWLADKKWHYYTAVFDGENAKVYFDGVVVNEWNMDGVSNTQKGLFTNGADLKYICLGGNQAWNWGDNDPGFAFDDIAIYDMALSATDIKNIMDVKLGNVPVSGPTPYWSSDFESTTGLTIVGGGSFVAKGDAHGTVFRNKRSSAPRQNYLLLPEDLLTHSQESQQLSISVWINSSQEGASGDYMWAPLLTAYAAKADENSWPMLACQYRGVLQVNNEGWTDYTDTQNVAGVNALYHDATDWLADREWHLYTVVFDHENAKVYFDGKVVNEWNMDGTDNTQTGLFNHGDNLKYICLGGNQAWNWADNDAAFEFDDIQFFDFALSESDIQAIMSQY